MPSGVNPMRGGWKPQGWFRSQPAYSERVISLFLSATTWIQFIIRSEERKRCRDRDKRNNCRLALLLLLLPLPPPQSPSIPFLKNSNRRLLSVVVTPLLLLLLPVVDGCWDPFETLSAQWRANGKPPPSLLKRTSLVETATFSSDQKQPKRTQIERKKNHTHKQTENKKKKNNWQSQRNTGAK